MVEVGLVEPLGSSLSTVSTLRVAGSSAFKLSIDSEPIEQRTPNEMYRGREISDAMDQVA